MQCGREVDCNPGGKTAMRSERILANDRSSGKANARSQNSRFLKGDFAQILPFSARQCSKILPVVIAEKLFERRHAARHYIA